MEQPETRPGIRRDAPAAVIVPIAGMLGGLLARILFGAIGYEGF